MSQQGQRPAADDWWNRLYEESAPDTGPAAASGDTLDDRFDSAADAVGTDTVAADTAGTDGRGAPDTPKEAPGPGPDGIEARQPRAWWEQPQQPPARQTPLQQPPARQARPSAEPPPPPYTPSDARPLPGSADSPRPERPSVPDPRRPEPGNRSSGGPADGPADNDTVWLPRQQGPLGSPAVGSAWGTPQPQPQPRPESEPPPPPPPTPAPAPAPTPTPTPTPAPAPPPPPPSAPAPAPTRAPAPAPAAPSGALLPSGPPPSGPPPSSPRRTSAAPPAPPAPPPPSTPRPAVTHLGDRPPTYAPQPATLPAADAERLHELVPDTVLDGASYGSYSLRTVSVRGDSARYRGEPRRDALLTARFGTGVGALVLVAVASGSRAAEGTHRAAADVCHWIGGAVGRSHSRLSEDIRAGRRGELKSGLHRLTDRGFGKLRARAAELGVAPEEYTAGLRCLLLSADPECRTRVFFGVGDGGLFRLRDGVWQDLEPAVPEPGAVTGAPVVGFGSRPAGALEADQLTMDLAITKPPSPYIEGPLPPQPEPFRFRASVARPGDTLLLCSGGLAEPLRGEPAFAGELAARWAPAGAPGLAEYLADIQLRIEGYADDRTAAGVWEE
ncbi:protein phosphatase 2C domain-containing protein [Streptomyces sp. NPDC050804]|uniref:protein phosphatase 2C domain-containing protein n=1 Tax=Streptomyces sp. NPDC050804 TaxID=3154745 RepID=UPI00342A5790